MAKRAIQNGYKEIYVGLMEEAVPSFLNKDQKFDHVVSLITVCFLPNNVFNDFLTSLFAMANKSVTLEIDEITGQFLTNLEKVLKFQSPLYNNIPIVEKFNLPSGERSCMKKENICEYPDHWRWGKWHAYKEWDK